MKTLFTFLVLAVTAIGFAEDFAIHSGTITSAAQTSSGGAYSLTGMIGQQSGTTPSAGGSYSLGAGFFSQYVALQQQGAPPLTIRQAGASIRIAWPGNVPGWVLQMNDTGTLTGSWTDIGMLPSVIGNEQFHDITPASGRAFFRLRQK